MKLDDLIEDRVAATRKVIAETGLSLPDPDVAALAEDLFNLYGWLAANLHHREAMTSAQKRAQLVTIRAAARKLAAALRWSPDIASLLESRAGSSYPKPLELTSCVRNRDERITMVRFAINRAPKLLGDLADGLLKKTQAQLEKVPRPPTDEWLIGCELFGLYTKYFGRSRAKPDAHGDGPRTLFVNACLAALGLPNKAISSYTVAKHRKRWLKRNGQGGTVAA
jgi:hypothetical protein